MGPDGRHVLSDPARLNDEERKFIQRLALGPIDNEELWIAAITHGSTGVRDDYQRLEFLGDRVLGLTIAEALYQSSDHAEGHLAQRLNALVSGKMCAQIAYGLDVREVVRLGKQAREDGGADSANIQGDVMESLLGAHYLTFGFDLTRQLILKLWESALDGNAGEAKHPKSALQEWAAGNKRRAPDYDLIDRSGPDHAAQFTVRVSVHNVGEAEATASSKSEAEKLAAQKFMEQFG